MYTTTKIFDTEDMHVFDRPSDMVGDRVVCSFITQLAMGRDYSLMNLPGVNYEWFDCSLSERACKADLWRMLRKFRAERDFTALVHCLWHSPSIGNGLEVLYRLWHHHVWHSPSIGNGLEVLYRLWPPSSLTLTFNREWIRSVVQTLATIKFDCFAANKGGGRWQ